MAAITPEEGAVLSKSLALIAKTRTKLERFDPSTFPTSSTKDALDLLSHGLRLVSDPALMGPMDPLVLYNRLIKLQRLVEDVEESNCDGISWPLVSHCDDIWRKVFGSTGPKIFYSVTREHNYSITSFSLQLRSFLQPLLPPSALKTLDDQGRIYCLRLASLEDANLPLYANIAHEFGHAVYDARQDEVSALFLSALDPLLDPLIQEIASVDPSAAARRAKRCIFILLNACRELFSDLFGASLLGPAFYLSLYEMSWGGSRSEWPIGLTPQIEATCAYPSFNFRLDAIKNWADLPRFDIEAKTAFVKLRTIGLRGIPAYLVGLRTAHDSDQLVLLQDRNDDGTILCDVLQKHLPAIKAAFRSFLDSSRSLLSAAYPEVRTYVSPTEVAELLLRLENSILPNIIPDGSLRGTPATFAPILTAAALYRLHLMLEGGAPEKQTDTARQMGRAERLAAKALEVSYVQHRYNESNRDQ